MALKRCFFLSKSQSLLPTLLSRHLFSHSSPPSSPFCTSTETTGANKRNPKLVNFSPSDSESDEASEPPLPEKPKLPPPYNPFSKESATREAHEEDPKNLQEVFAKIREDGLMKSAAKMFDGLSQDGLTHEALELFGRIKDRGEMPEVIGHTAVMEAYVEAGQSKEAHKVYLRMLASGVLPNAYTYRVLIRGLAESGEAKEANKYVREMVVRRRMRPNAETCVAVFEALLGAGLQNEGMEMLQMLKAEDMVPDENKVRDFIKNNRGRQNIAASLINILYGR